MARPLRIEFEGALDHVTARGNERRKIFFGRRDYEKFLEYLNEAIGKFGIIVHGYVCMPNHYHLIIETTQANLSRTMHYVNGSYTTYVNTKRKRSGHLLQGRFKSIVIDRDSYLLELSRYLHLNPVRAQMVDRPENYPYSSYGTFIGCKSDPRVTTSVVLGMIGGIGGNERDAYRSFVESALGTELESPMAKVYGGTILGREDFIDAVLKKVSVGKRSTAEISYRKCLSAAVLPGQIIAVVRRHCGISEAEAMCGECRKICLYLLKRWTSAKNTEIGEMLGGMGVAAVAKGYQRFVQKLEKDEEMKGKIEQIEREMSRVRGCPL